MYRTQYIVPKLSLLKISRDLLWTEIAQQSGVSKWCIDSHLYGRESTPSLNVVYKLARWAEVEPDYFFTDYRYYEHKVLKGNSFRDRIILLKGRSSYDMYTKSIHCSTWSLNKYLNGSGFPPIRILLNICNNHRISVSSILPIEEVLE